MSSTMTTSLSTSNLRASSRQTRTNPTRTSKIVGTVQRQNSLISNPPLPLPNPIEPHGFYPAIQHFTDAITALPRDYRRHTSLLKEVDAKAWAPEENLQALLTQCLAEATSRPTIAHAEISRDGANSIPSENAPMSAANSTTGIPPDNLSQYSSQSANPAALQRRHLFSNLRQNLTQMMVTMDEKNHVINNANEELSRHVWRLDNIFPHIADEVSEEARLGSLKHWAYTEINKTHKAQTSRREAAASLAIMHDTDIAQRSESRREAMLAKKQRFNQVDSDFDDTRATGRKTNMNGKSRRIGEIAAESAGLGISGISTGKRKKPERPPTSGTGMERSLSGALGGRTMSREPSQQEGSKKRKAPTSATTVARKRLNTNPHDSPKLASSPLAGAFGKDAHKRSPIPSAVRPVPSRARQNSNQNTDSTRARPSSSASYKTNGNGPSAAITTDLNNIAALTGKLAEIKNTIKESAAPKADRLMEEGNSTTNGLKVDTAPRGSLPLERSSSRSGALKREAESTEEASTIRSSRIPAPLVTSDLRGDRNPRGRGSKTSTPVIGSFAESDTADTTSFKGPSSSITNGNGSNNNAKRPARPRMKDHGLHDSLSPKALPPKRSHKKGAGILAMQQQQQAQQAQMRHAEDAAANSSSAPDGLDGDDDIEGDEEDEEEQRYCYCNGVSYGEMVACDNKGCTKEWFHLECAGLKTAPLGKAKWYCEDCKETLARRGKLGSFSNGSGISVGGNGK